MTNDDNPHITGLAAAAASKVEPEPADESAPEVEALPSGTVVATASRQIQLGEVRLDVVEGEPVEVPAPHKVEDWVEAGYVRVVE